MSDVIARDPEILSGTPVFRGTRVPVKNFFDCIEAGYSIKEFLNDFPAVTEAQIKSLIREMERDLGLTAA